MMCASGSAAVKGYKYGDHKIYRALVINELGHRVETDYDITSGIVVEARGPNKWRHGLADDRTV